MKIITQEGTYGTGTMYAVVTEETETEQVMQGWSMGEERAIREYQFRIDNDIRLLNYRIKK